MNKLIPMVLVIVLTLFFYIFTQAQELKQSGQKQLQISQETKLPDTSSVFPNIIQKPALEPVLADATIIVPLLDFKDVEVRDILNSLVQILGSAVDIA